MDIAELAVHDDSQFSALFALYQAVHAVDCPDSPAPLWDALLASLRQDHREGRVERLTAWVDGQLVGSAAIALPGIDNRHVAVIDLKVTPLLRRRGIGRSLFDRLHRRSREERRQVIVAQASQAVPDGPPRSEAGRQFLTAVGFTAALENVRRRLDLSTIDYRHEQELLEECLPHAMDYELRTWTGLTPDELASGVAQLVNGLSKDVPRGSLNVTATTLDSERLRASERTTIGHHSQLVGAAATHKRTGKVVAFTRIDIRWAGDHANMWLTVVDPQHRGHRLGTAVKISAQRLARRTSPRLRYVYTENADANPYMAAINERLGYAAYEAVTSYQLVLLRDSPR